jgi:hypothetical protein
MTAYSRLQAERLRNLPPDKTGAVVMKLQMQLSQLWELHRRESDSARLVAMNNRAMEVLKEVAKRAWEDYQSLCEDTVEATCRLWCQCEVLVNATAEVDGMDEKGFVVWV